MDDSQAGPALVLEPHWLFKTSLISAFVSIVFTLFLLKITYVTAPALVGTYGVSFVLDLLLLRKFVISDWLFAGLVTVPQAALIYFMSHLGTFFSLPTPGFITSELLSEVRFCFYVALFIVLAAILEIILYAYAGRANWKFAFLAGILLIPVYFAAAHIGAQQLP